MFSGIFGKPPPRSPGEKAIQLASEGDDEGGNKGGRGKQASSGLFDPSGLER
jgi:hypothetical protein